MWWFLSNMDFDFVNAEGKPAPPSLATARVNGPAVTCGRNARMLVRQAVRQ